MPFATTHCVSLDGATGHLIDVQADVSPGQVATVLVGRPDSALSESRDRCRMAIINSRFDWPNTRRTTILLSPADLPKRGTHYDLAIAVGILGALGEVPVAGLVGTVFLGELTLSGGLRSVRGVLPMALAAKQRGMKRIVVPEPQVGEAAMAGGLEVLGMRSLAQVVAELRGEEIPAAPPVAPMSGGRLLSWRGQERLDEVDLSDLRGMADARYAAEVAAAGGHHLLLSGPKGSGKTSLAERIPGMLPDLSREEAVELTALYSLAGAIEPGDSMVVRPPFAAPHHDASRASVVGGGSGQVRPGEISRAHCGVLFLDEFPLFRTDVIDALREPMEGGDITIARADECVRLPARESGGAGRQPVPVRQLPRRGRPRRVHVQRPATPSLPGPGPRTGAGPRRHHQAPGGILGHRSRRHRRLGIDRGGARTGECRPRQASHSVHWGELAAQRPGPRTGTSRALAAAPRRRCPAGPTARRWSPDPAGGGPLAPPGLDDR